MRPCLYEKPKERLWDILEAIANIERYAVLGRDAFETDELVQNWFLRQLQIIGEAARAMPRDIIDLSPQIPYAKIIGMRNILVHGYFEIDTEVVWGAVKNDIPALKLQIEDLLRKLDQRT
ncbi:MAG: HepT-like ribonuclease domain-containing protein [bacterium]